MRIHDTTPLRPAELIAIEGLPQLIPVPDEAFDIRTRTHPKLGLDQHGSS